MKLLREGGTHRRRHRATLTLALGHQCQGKQEDRQGSTKGKQREGEARQGKLLTGNWE